MKKFLDKICCLFFILFFQLTILYSASYGRWTRADLYTAATVIFGAGNVIEQLAIFDGLTFQDSATSCVYRAMFPIRGTVNLNGGTLLLQRDLEIEDSILIAGAGKVAGDSTEYTLSFPGNLFTWGYTYTFQDLSLLFNADLVLEDSFTFQNTCTVDFGGRQLDLREGGTIFVAPAAEVTLKNVSVVGVKDSNVRCLGSDSCLYLDNSELLLSGDYTFSYGVFDVYHESMISGTGIFGFQSDQNFAIHSKSKLLLDREVTFSYDSAAASKEKLVFEDETATLYLRGCTLYSTHTGLKLQGGTVIFEDLVTLQSEAQVPAEAMEFVPSLTVNILAGATVDIVGGDVIH